MHFALNFIQNNVSVCSPLAHDHEKNTNSDKFTYNDFSSPIKYKIRLSLLWNENGIHSNFCCPSITAYVKCVSTYFFTRISL